LTAIQSSVVAKQINAFLVEEAVSNGAIASVQTIGQSFEGRDLNVIKIAKSSTKKPVIFVEAS
jgi:murein tripeptide amidase MpaA